MASTSSPKTSRIPFTPSKSSSSSLGIPRPTSRPSSRPTTPTNLRPPTPKLRSAVSTEARRRTISKPRPINTNSSPVPPVPKIKTPNTPKRATIDDMFLLESKSEMDVSRVDPEEVLVDAQNVELADVSAELDEAMLREILEGKEDKVLVSVRIRPSDALVAWDTPAAQPKTIKLNPQYSRNSTSSLPEFTFDEMLTGSENKPVYNAVARNHVYAAMDGYNSVIFAYGQTASGKTFTLSGDEDQPGIIPRAMKDVFAYIRRTPTREYLLRCSYLEIYNENINDLLAPPSSNHLASSVQINGTGSNVYLSPLREEVVTSLKGVHQVLERGWANRRTATTDWNERSSRSHSVFRVVIESRERSGGDASGDVLSGRQTPGTRPPTPGGPRLQAIGGRSVQTSVLSLIDLAGSEKATSDKERTREGKFINTSLLTLGQVISTLGENAVKHKHDYVPFRNSKLTRMLEPSLSGNARISVICTINPDTNAVAETTSTLKFAQGIKKVQLKAKKKEVVDTEALLERYRQEIEDLKRRLADKERDVAQPSTGPVAKDGSINRKGRRLSAREQLEESRAMQDLNSRIRQLTKLIVTSQTVDQSVEQSRPATPAKVDFDMSPYQLQQELLSARREIETQANQILSLEAALCSRPALPADAPESEKDKLIADQSKTIRELEIVVAGYEENLGEPLRAVREDVEKEWIAKVEEEKKKREEKEVWAEELVRQLDREKKIRTQFEEQSRALFSFLQRFDASAFGGDAPSSSSIPSYSFSRPALPFGERQRNRVAAPTPLPAVEETGSPVKLDVHKAKTEPSLLEEKWDGTGADEESFELVDKVIPPKKSGSFSSLLGRRPEKENRPASGR